MNAVPAADQAPISTVVWSRIYEAWKPRQRRRKLAPIGKHNDNAITGH
jgi:hypothetical protein